MRIRDFLGLVYDELPPLLPEPLRDHRWRVRFSFLQVYFETPRVHYEVWVQKRNRRIELGLHFECEREESYRWAEAMARRAIEIQGELGPSVELEEWTSAWTRLHESLPLESELDARLAKDVARRLARFIEVLEPLRAQERAAVVAG